MPATIRGLDFLMLPSLDLERSEHFYSELLGLAVEAHWGDMGVEFQLAPDLTLAVMDPRKIGNTFEPFSAGSVALKVDDVDAARRRLEALGITFAGETIDSGVCKMAIFHDPDGNGLMLHHRYAP